jgi:hypothetical protein
VSSALDLVHAEVLQAGMFLPPTQRIGRKCRAENERRRADHLAGDKEASRIVGEALVDFVVVRVDREGEPCPRGEPVDRIQPRNVFQVIDQVMAERRKEGATRLAGFFSHGGGRWLR